MRPLATLAALLAVPLVAAQTYTDCNPLKEDCPDNPAMGKTLTTDFTKGKSSDWEEVKGPVSYGKDGVELTVARKGQSPTIQTSKYFFFGTAEVVMKTAPGTGIVSSIVLMSDVLDEIDWEALGGDNAHIQTNYFGKGEAIYGLETHVPVDSPQTKFHTYKVNWQKDKLEWIVNGKVVRTLKASEAGDHYPQTPMRLLVGIWAGGDPDNSPGTIEWAGGETDYSQAPFSMYVKEVKIENANPGKAYHYSDHSGDADSIEVIGGSSPSDDDDDDDDKDDKDGKDDKDDDDKTSSSTSDSTKTKISDPSSSTSGSSPSSSDKDAITNPITGITYTSGTDSDDDSSAESSAAASELEAPDAAVLSSRVSGSLIALCTSLVVLVGFVL